MLLFRCGVILIILVLKDCFAQHLLSRRFRRGPMQSAMRLKQKLQDKIQEYRQKNTQVICYDTVGCFNLPHRRSPLQKMPEDPETLDTKFLLLRRNINYSSPEIIYYDDDSKSLKESKFNFSQPLKLIVHGYMSKWYEKGHLIVSDAYLKLDDCNVILMDWGNGARGPHYTTAAANTEVVGRQLGFLLLKLVEEGLNASDIHLIGFSLGAHVAGSSSELLKKNGHLIGRITGLDAASPLFRTNHLREKHKKLDREDAKFVDVVHTDSSPYATDGFGLWEPIGHVDFFPNGGQEQPGCSDSKQSIVVANFEKGLTRDLACSHIRAWHLFQESLLNKVSGKNDTCEFISYSCPGGLPSFERGHCFPHLDSPKSKLYLDPSYRSEIGKLGEDARGEGVMYVVTRGAPNFCGTQIQASVQISQKTKPTIGILQMNIMNDKFSASFNIKCEIVDFIMTGTVMNGLGIVEFNSLTPEVNNMTAIVTYMDQDYEEENTTVVPTVFIDRIVIRDMYGNSWQFCGKDTILQDKRSQHQPMNLTLSKNTC